MFSAARERAISRSRSRSPMGRSARTSLLRTAGGSRGSATVELAILAPVLLLIIWLSVQFAFWYQGRQAALAAAQAGDRVARQEADVSTSWRLDAVNRATSYYSELGTRVDGGAITASAWLAGDQAQVRVTGKVVSIVPGLTLIIHETVRGPVECFRPASSGGQRCGG